MEEKVNAIKNWLGTGSINIFGLPMSGKDTQGLNLARLLGAKFVSSGEIIRQHEAEVHKSYTRQGNLAPTDVFYDLVMPYFSRADLADYPLILSSIGRWSGEEDTVMATASANNHPIKVAILLNISEADVENRFTAAKTLGDRGERADDRNLETFRTRTAEFREKTMPVVEHYKELGLLLSVNGDQPRDLVFTEIVDGLYKIATAPGARF